MKKEMLINVLQPEECRIAIVEDGVLEELYVERTSHESYTGNIYKGKVVNIEPAIQAAFVDFSVGRNGFLHISDVEPQYYYRHQAEESEREPRREREDRRRGRAEERESGPARTEERYRDRPDRSERGRRDRSEPRRFGEGLLNDDWPPPPPRAPEPERIERDEPRPARAEVPIPSWDEDKPFGRAEEPEARPAPPEEPRGRIGRPVEPFDPDLPPSRTQRTRMTPPPPRPADLDVGESGRVHPSAEVEPPAEPLREREPGRGRGRGQPTPGPESEPPDRIESEDEPDPLSAEVLPEPTFEDRAEILRRRGGRAAIRSRGGDRDRERPREREREVEPERPREPPAERTRSLAADRVPELDTERLRPSAESERAREPEPPRERTKPHDRAGEPGYVPRRERHRATDLGPGTEPPPSPPFAWPERAAEPEVEPEVEAEIAAEDLAPGAGRMEPPRRRRRRRGRRRERGRPEQEAAGTPSAEEFETDFDDEEAEPEAEHEPIQHAAIEAEETHLDEFDFGDEPEHEREREAEECEEEDEEAISGELHGAAPVREEEEIDPELEEEIRREIEEIAELEREMGLRGFEARPHRGDEAEPGRGGRFARGRGMAKPAIQDVFRRGDEVLVQVIKESIGTKGPTLSTYISIPGRYLVLMPGLNRVGVSRKIADEGQRRKLREIMNELNPPKGLGFIVRTAGLERTKRELARDLAYLLRLWKVILRRIKKARAPAPIYQESDMITRTIRDIFTSEIDTIWIDESAAFERAQEFLRVVMPRFVNRLKLFSEKVPLFHKYGIEDEIAKIQRRHVPLPEGGSIVIDQTEAVVAIDVNSGNFRVENDAEKTAYEMNLRAAKEIARQLRLRDLGGVIVNDFIDMRDERHRRGVERALRDAIKRDRARTKVLRMSAFGLIEMTRQRIRPSLKRSVYEDCSHCAGAGVVKTVESMSIDVMRLLALASHREDIRRVNVGVSIPVATYLNNRKRREIARIEGEANMTIHIRGEESAPAEHLQIDCFDGNSSEVRLLPQPAPSSRRALH
ncbi:MAG: Rne/Rng family ribonuclease [Planctomycetaceae bacterium]